MKKRILALLLTLVMIFSAVPLSGAALGLSTSGSAKEPAHEGCLKNDPDCTKLLETVKKEATCKEEGSKEIVWACGKLVYEVIQVTEEHNWTSLKEGEWFCMDCGTFTTEDPNPETPAEPAHEGCLKNDPECTILLETVKKETTCKEEGSKEIVWACGKLVFEVIPVTDEHDWLSLKEGEWFCKNCGKFTAEDPNPEEPAEPAHEGCLQNDPECTILLETVRKEATCTEEGSKEIVWACGKLVFEVLSSAGAHTWEDGVCAACGEKSPLGTAPDDKEPAHEGCLKSDPDCTILLETVRKEATCKEEGSKEIVWACGKLVFEVIPVTGEHNWTSLKEGEWFCLDCGKFTTENPNPEEPAEPAHEGCLENDPDCTILLETVRKEATCKQEGNKEVVWACGKLVFEVIPVTDEHDWLSLKEGEWFCKNCGKFTTEDPNPEEPAEPAHEGCLKNDPDCTILLETVRKEATCTQEGSKEIVWACGKLTFETIPATGTHTWANGVCSVCGEKSPFVVAPVTPKHDGCLKPKTCTGKVLLETVKKAATCTADGQKELVWACGKLTFETIPATGTHTWANGVCKVCGEKSPFQVAPKCEHPSGVSIAQKVVEATCEKDGYILTTKVCNECGQNYQITSPLTATGHKYTINVPAKAATCTEDGHTAYTQCVCGAKTLHALILATGHNFVDGTCSKCGAITSEKIFTFDFQDIFIVG